MGYTVKVVPDGTFDGLPRPWAMIAAREGSATFIVEESAARASEALEDARRSAALLGVGELVGRG